MPSILEVADLDGDFRKLPKDQVVIINDIPNRTEADQAYFNDLIREVYTTDMISLMPKCACPDGKGLKGEHRVGVVCPRCNSPVKQAIEDDIKPVLWFRKPKGITKLIHPNVIAMLEERFAKRNFSPIRYLMDRSYVAQGAKPAAFKKLVAANLPRGYNSFVENFYEILSWLIRSPDFKNLKSADRFVKGMVASEGHQSDDLLEKMLIDNKDRIFCDYLPLPNRATLVIEQSFSKNYVEGYAVNIHNALNTMRSIDTDFHDQRTGVIENRTARILFMLAKYMEEYIDVNFKPKHALVRKHAYGGRGNHSMRAVITSHEDIQDHDVVVPPWSAAVATYWQHLVAVLLNPKSKYGRMTHRQVTDKLMRGVNHYDFDIDQIFKDAINSKPDKCLVGLWQRN